MSGAYTPSRRARPFAFAVHCTLRVRERARQIPLTRRALTSRCALRSWIGRWVRRGAAFTGLGKHEEARKAYLRATQLEPSNQQLVQFMAAAEMAAKKETEKRWEDDLWSDDDEKGEGGGAGKGGEGGEAGSKRAAPPPSAGAAGSGDGDDALELAAKRRRRKPGAALLSQLDRSLKDASEDTLRACLQQLASVDEDLAERTLHILEGLNAASSAGDDDDDDDDAGGGGGSSTADWLRGSGGGGRGGGGGGSAGGRGRGSRRGRGGDSDSD